MKTFKAVLMAWGCLAMAAAPGIYAKKTVLPWIRSGIKYVQLQKQIQDMKDNLLGADTTMTFAQKPSRICSTRSRI